MDFRGVPPLRENCCKVFIQSGLLWDLMGKVFIPLGYFVKSSIHWSYGSVFKALLAVLGLAGRC